MLASTDTAFTALPRPEVNLVDSERMHSLRHCGARTMGGSYDGP